MIAEPPQAHDHAARGASDGDRGAVLIVDDRPENLLALEATLEPLSIRIVRAGSGEEALARVAEEEFAVVLLDVRMPGLDGFETADRIHATSVRTPLIVFVTAHGTDKASQLRGYGLRAVDYVVKPFDPDVLRSKIDVLLSLHESERAREREHRRRTEAERGANLRDEFLTVASHELRTPATALRLSVQLLQRRITDPTTFERTVARMDRQSRKLVEMIETLFEAAGVDARESIEIATVPCELADLTRRALETVAPEARARNVAVVTDLAANVTGYWDAKRLERAIACVVSNAISFGEKSSVEVRVDGDESVGRVTIVDRGRGIAQEDQARIFERFVRVQPRQEQTGFGLGLWVCARNVRAMGGSVSVQSGVGAGATFRIEVPRGMRA